MTVPRPRNDHFRIRRLMSKSKYEFAGNLQEGGRIDRKRWSDMDIKRVASARRQNLARSSDVRTPNAIGQARRPRNDASDFTAGATRQPRRTRRETTRNFPALRSAFKSAWPTISI